MATVVESMRESSKSSNIDLEKAEQIKYVDDYMQDLEHSKDIPPAPTYEAADQPQRDVNIENQVSMFNWLFDCMLLLLTLNCFHSSSL